MKADRVIMAAIIVFLLILNWLTFHDLLEPHTLRDWLILLTSILVFFFLFKRLKTA